jgi:hypothetical protein
VARFNLEGFTPLSWFLHGPRCLLAHCALVNKTLNPFPYVLWFVSYVVSLVVVAGHRALMSVLCAIVVVACLLISPRLGSVFFWAVPLMCLPCLRI